MKDEHGQRSSLDENGDFRRQGIDRTTLPITRRGFIAGSGLAIIGGYLSFVAAQTISVFYSATGLHSSSASPIELILDSATDLSDALSAKLFENLSFFGDVTDVFTAVDILRYEDLLALSFRFENLKLVSKGGGLLGGKRKFSLIPTNPTIDSLIVIEFAPQHLLEKCYFQASQAAQSDIPEPAPVNNILSGKSRLAFKLPKDVESIPFTVSDLLDWNRLTPSVVAAAVANGEIVSAGPQQPSESQTSIEFPYHLFLSTHEKSAWIHSDSSVGSATTCAKTIEQPLNESGGVRWVELWHTRLASQPYPGVISDDNKYFRTVRAVWATEMSASATQPQDDCLPSKKNPDPPFLASMAPSDRLEIVKLSSSFTGFEESPEKDKWMPYLPRPIPINKLLLTSQGATINSDAKWPIVRPIGGSRLNIREWQHQASLGRDQYVRVVYGGFLYPYGHPCTLIQITERRFQKPGLSPAPSDAITAYLRQEITIAITVPIKESGNSGLKDVNEFSIDRKMPIKQIRITSETTPPLDRPDDPGSVVYSCSPRGVAAFWPLVAGKKFFFHLKKTDVDGNLSECLSPAIFVVQSKIEDDAVLRAVASAWGEANEWCDLNGQKVAFVPSTPDIDAKLETIQINFDAFIPRIQNRQNGHNATNKGTNLAIEADSCDLPKPEPPAPWEPVIEGAKVKIPAVEQLTGTTDPVGISWDPNYLIKGFDLNIPRPNVGELFARLDLPSLFSLPAARSVSLIKPEFGLKGLSRKFGPVGGTDGGLFQFGIGNLHVEDLLSGVNARILGALDLVKILFSPISFDVSGGNGRVPRTNTRIIYDSNGIPIAIESSLKWTPQLTDLHTGIVDFERGEKPELELEVIVTKWIRGSEGVTYSLRGRLTDFRIIIVKAIRIEFDKFTFVSTSGQKPVVDVSIRLVTFQGALAFVNRLQDFLSSSAFGSQGPSLVVTPNDVTVSAGWALPNLSFGVFSLQNLRLSSRLFLPLRGDTPVRLRVAFGERHSPFILAVTFLGGGGFVATSVGLDGIESIEIALEFGGIVSLSLGVAEGNAYIVAGIYILYQKQPSPGTLLSGYVRCGGSLRIIGLITVSIEVYLGLAYDSCSGRVWGTAEVTVEVSIAFFSTSVSFRIEREFAGGKERSCLDEHSRRLTDTSNSSDANSQVSLFRDLMPRGEWKKYWRAFDLSI